MSDANGRYMPPEGSELQQPPVTPEPPVPPTPPLPQDPSVAAAPVPAEPPAPQFGQRSENWSATPTPPQNPAAPAGNPWPVYEPGQPAPQPQQAWGAPNAPGPVAGGPQGYRGPTGPMPSRTGAIWTLVMGIVSMIVIAPVVFFTVFATSIDFEDFMTGMVDNGGTVTVDETGSIGVMSTGSGEPVGCVLTSGDDEIPLVSIDGVVGASGVAPGTYTLTCESGTAGGLMTMSGEAVAGLMQGTITALIVSTVIGFIGVGLTIGGIIWLVARNRARREYMRMSW